MWRSHWGPGGKEGGRFEGAEPMERSAQAVPAPEGADKRVMARLGTTAGAAGRLVTLSLRPAAL